MRTLIYGMQSSGASLFCYWMAQKRGCVAVIDLYHDQVAPHIDHPDVVLKCVATKGIGIDRHIDSFRPDRVILFCRNPVENCLSLSEKVYANFGGTVDEKLGVMDGVVGSGRFKTVVRYEDFIMGRVPEDLGSVGNYEFDRTIDEVKGYNFDSSNWCRENYKKRWGTGNIHGSRKALSLLRPQTRDSFKSLGELY